MKKRQWNNTPLIRKCDIMKSFRDKKAVAIHYDPAAESIPTVIARGKGLVAENMMEVAKKENVPMIKKSSLVEELLTVDIGQDIPEELYEVIAEVLVFVNDLDELERRLKNHETE